MWHERVIFMNEHIYLPGGHTKALDHAMAALTANGCDLATKPVDVVTHLLLPVPSFEPDGSLKGGGDLKELLGRLSPDVIVFGGNLDRPELRDYRCGDFLKDPYYLAENANITAHCAVKIAMQNLPVTLQDCPVLVIGWGRIGKCLAALLRQMGAIVAVAALKEEDRAMLRALGYGTERIPGLDHQLIRYRVVFNTAPALLLTREQLQHCSRDCLLIDLASQPGMEAEGVLWARGLPNKEAPESSGLLMARTALRLAAGKEFQL